MKSVLQVFQSLCPFLAQPPGSAGGCPDQSRWTWTPALSWAGRTACGLSLPAWWSGPIHWTIHPDRASANVAADQERLLRRASDPLGHPRARLLTTRSSGGVLQMRAYRSEFGWPHRITNCSTFLGRIPGPRTLRADTPPHRQASSLLAAYTPEPCCSGRCAAASTR